MSAGIEQGTPDIPSAVRLTVFRDRFARTKTEELTDLDALCKSVRTIGAHAKERLPLLKLATFGNLRSDKDSLRHNANVLAISGIEADYDGECVSFDDACTILSEANVTALAYTSPSHTEDAPRWRVLCPFSKEYPPDNRDAFMGRLNGLFHGIFSVESWTLSQSFYLGSVNKNLSHRAEIIRGTPIDLLTILDEAWIGRPGATTGTDSEQGKARPIGSSTADVPVSSVRLERYRNTVLETLQRGAVDGQKHVRLRGAARTLGGIQAEAGFSDADAVQRLMDALPNTVEDWVLAASTAAWALAKGREQPITLKNRPPDTRKPNGASTIRTNEIDREAVAGLPGADNSRSGIGTRVDDHDDAAPRYRRTPVGSTFAWPEPLDFFADLNTRAPELLAHHIPPAINDFVFDTAGRMGVDPASVALAAIVSCAAVIDDAWRVQPKRYDYEWTESARLWCAIVGDPGILKSPTIATCTRPIDRMEAAARERYTQAMRLYRQQMKAAKADKTDETQEPSHPKRERYLVEDATVEALMEVLRNDDESRQRVPSGKALVRQDEMSEFFANLDRYRQGGKGGGDRGAFLRLYNGGGLNIDRIGRGNFHVPNWSACFLGGIQPGPIQQIAKSSVEDGLLQRFLYVVPGPQKPGQDRKPLIEARRQYDALFPALAAMHPPPVNDGEHTQPIVFHADAHRHREAIDKRARTECLFPDRSPQLLNALAKWPGQFARLALTFHLIDIADARACGKPAAYLMVIPEATAARVGRFMLEIVLPHLLRAHRAMFDTSQQTSHAEWIAGYILAERLDRITTGNVVHSYRALRSPENRAELISVMGALVLYGWLEPQAPTNAFKPVGVWLVNPKVHDLFAQQGADERARRETARAELAAHFKTCRQT